MKESKKILFFSLIVFTLSFFDSAQAQDRWSYLYGDDTFTVYYDSKTVNRSSNYVDVWVKWQYEKEYQYGSKYIDHTMNKVRYYCNNRTLLYLKYIIYFTDESSVEDELSKETPDEPTPGTVSEIIWEYFCE